jgi:hypothetical protein
MKNSASLVLVLISFLSVLKIGKQFVVDACEVLKTAFGT